MNSVESERRRGSADQRILFATLAGSPLREFFYYCPRSAGPDSEILVLVHGVTRRAAEHIFRFREAADRSGVILIAPFFSKARYGQYQQIVDPRSGTRADLALFDMLDEMARRTGVSVRRLHLFGYSGGAQFVHRFSMIHPDRVQTMVAASAGWYTMPDPDRLYPMGIASHPVQGMAFAPDRFLAVDRHVFVGSEDRLRDESLRISADLDTLQGLNRLERARRWFDAMEEASHRQSVRPARSSFQTIRGVGHSFGSSARRRSLPERVMNHVFARLQEPLKG